MKRVIQVYLGSALRLVGTIRYDVQGARESSSFEYASEWLAAKDRFALAPGLPLVTGPQFHRRNAEGSAFSGVFADTEPDGWGRRVILRDRAKRKQNKRTLTDSSGPPSSIDFLLAVDDISRIGAIRLKDENGVFQRSYEEGRRGVPPLLELKHLLAASRAVETHSETAADLEYLQGRGTSLGGLRPKCSIIDKDGHLAIGKFPSVSDERAVTKGEVLALKLANECGIQTAEARLVESGGLPVAVIRRFDRTPKTGRLLFISAATLLGVEANDAEQRAYTEVVDALRIYSADAQRDIEELWRRIAFYILINNVDDHLRNLGFLHVAGGKWKLSPAYDVNPFPDRARELKTWISEDAGPEASLEALMAVAPYFRLSAKRAKAILSEVRRGVSRWRKEGKSLKMTRSELDEFAPAFEHESI